MPPVTFLYTAFGDEAYFYEVLFSYLSLRHVTQGAPVHVVVYTDKPEWFAPYPGLNVERMNPEDLVKWIGVAGCVFRAKIQIMRDCMDHNPDNLLYLDGDTIFTADPRPILAKLSADTAIMNFPEAGRLSGLFQRASERVIKASTDLWTELGMPDVPNTWRMWNAGVIGLHRSHRPLLDQVVYVNDVLFHRSLNRIIEQVAQSVVLGSRCQLTELDHEIIHYFAMEKGFLPSLKSFMVENRHKPFDELLRLAAAFRPDMAHDPKLHGKRKWRNSLHKRKKSATLLLRRLFKRRTWAEEIEASRRLALASLNQ